MKPSARQNADYAHAENRTGGLPHVYADERAIRQIVVNLLSNAHQIHAGRRRGQRVRADARPTAGSPSAWRTPASASPRKIKAHVFERFGRGRHDVASRKGTGLGLAIVKGFAEAHDGDVDSAKRDRARARA